MLRGRRGGALVILVAKGCHVLLAAATFVGGDTGVRCDPGTYYSGDEPLGENGKQVICSKCKPGSFGPGASAEDKPRCEPCMHGQYARESGLDECTHCAVGQWQASAGQTSCAVCPPG